MATIVHDCPRCRANRMTFDVIADVHVGFEHGWAHEFEICVVCRRCSRPSLMRVSLSVYDERQKFAASGTLTKLQNDLEPVFLFERFVDFAEIMAKPAPTNLPPDINASFEEGARCLAVGCPNASSAMFRLCLDLATKGLLPDSNTVVGLDKQTRRNLSPRLRWLFDNSYLPADLHDLSTSVKENGDDGAHDGSLDSNDAEDIYDFAFALLDRVFSEPARLADAAKRRSERRT